MEFKLKFVTDPHKYVVNTETMDLPKSVGLRQLTYARKKLGVRFDVSIMEENIERLLCNPSITVSENLAWKSGLFRKKATEEIFISAEKKEEVFINFIRFKVSTVKDFSFEKLESVRLEYVLNEKALIQYWIKKGFPTKII